MSIDFSTKEGMDMEQLANSMKHELEKLKQDPSQKVIRSLVATSTALRSQMQDHCNVIFPIYVEMYSKPLKTLRDVLDERQSNAKGDWKDVYQKYLDQVDEDIEAIRTSAWIEMT